MKKSDQISSHFPYKMKKRLKKQEKPWKLSKGDEKKLFAFLATLLSVVGFIIALIAKKDDEYVMFYAKQSLMIFILYIISSVFFVLPFIGEFVGWVFYILTAVLWIISFVYALSGEMKQVPLVGEYADKINL